MKRLATLIGFAALLAAMAVPVMAWGPGWGWGHHRMGSWGSGAWTAGSDFGNLTADQRSRLSELDRAFQEDTRDLRERIWARSRELDNALSNANPDLERVKTLQREISDLRAEMDQRTIEHELEARKIAPDRRMGSGYGRGPYGGRAMGYGAGGTCWN